MIQYRLVSSFVDIVIYLFVLYVKSTASLYNIGLPSQSPKYQYFSMVSQNYAIEHVATVTLPMFTRKQVEVTNM